MQERYASREQMVRDIGRLTANGWALHRFEKLPGEAVRVECDRCGAPPTDTPVASGSEESSGRLLALGREAGELRRALK